MSVVSNTCKDIFSIAEQFKSDDEVEISNETEEFDITEEVHHILKIIPTLIANFSAHRPATGMVHYSLESSCRQDSKEYEINLRGGL